MKYAGVIPHHFTVFFLNRVETRRPVVNGLQGTSYPAPGKMASRGVAFAMLGELAGNMMTGWAYDLSAAGPYAFEMNDTQATVLKKDFGQFQFRFQGFDLPKLIKKTLKAVITGFLGGLEQKRYRFISQVVLDGFLKINIVVMTMHRHRLSG